ncbi:non-hydrolyzing UDP-N-acetylglucosamine 2-epimerase [Oceanirhabdus sp. W0125-5]|uniref:non-hydrolyzing UDP-N-acetylglucosamine 2-epimerase n=1 Tax=Oceanirhabdus sp. W0125-5 TaxID=2999116 RepID=UPI0022F2D91A|nr:UDP-N-acetylglucosamine 2-epimerase (non-hydrolyzing) [Oceanirhabdus sp. W0125-5]WBW98745.1 UDP-N-acetylglucosamine 2-epimerase (non-hydrolyzing) [Oceanirhabdus sp. W0125-5]
MKAFKVLLIFGTRPEATKMASVIKALEKSQSIEYKICVTAQHREMLDEILEIYDITPDYDLDIMKHKQSLSHITSSILIKIEEILEIEKPDMVLVHGDTTTTFSSSLAAFYKKIKVGHVEAGLRSFNKYLPYPEEINRRLTGVMADYHFAPTEFAKQNLLNEGVKEENIFVTGNTGVDAVDMSIKEDYVFENKILNSIDYKKDRIIMVTAHRRENWGGGIDSICDALIDIVKKNEGVKVIYPVHMNPIVKETVHKKLNGIKNIILTETINVKDSHNLMKRSYLVLTDSGGIQEEAPHLNKPVLVMRDVTERQEGVMAGTLILVGTDKKNIVDNVQLLLDDDKKYKNMSEAQNPYGDGKAGERIVKILEEIQ